LSFGFVLFFRSLDLSKYIEELKLFFTAFRCGDAPGDSVVQSKDDPEMGFGFQYKVIVKSSEMGDGAAGILSGSFAAPDADQREALGS